MHKKLGAQMLARGLEVKDLKNWRKVIFTMLTLVWSWWKDKLASGAKNFSWILKEFNMEHQKNSGTDSQADIKYCWQHCNAKYWEVKGKS